MAKPTNPSEIKRVGKFGAVGMINTIIDFTLFNVISGPLGLPIVPANRISTGVAMVISFFANKRLVFGSRSGSLARQAALFFAVTAFGLWVLQTGVISFLVGNGRPLIDWTYQIVKALALGGIFPEDFVIKNTAKVIGTVFSLTWNYLMYKKVVFKQ